VETLTRRTPRPGGSRRGPDGQREDVQHALALLQQVDDLLAAADEHGALAGDDEVHARDVLAEVVAQVAEDLADRFEPDAGVEQRLDRLELEEVAVAVQPAAAAALGVGQRRPHQVRSGPVVELPIRDAHDLGRLLPAEPVL
jgi:hypothetical protein